MQIKILSNISSYLEDIEEQKQQWLFELLHYVGINVEDLSALPGDLAVEYLLKNHISVCDYPSMGALKVEYRKSPDEPLQILGEWAGPDFVMKTDPENGELYYEIFIETWSVIDEAIEME